MYLQAYSWVEDEVIKWYLNCKYFMLFKSKQITDKDLYIENE